jgi:oxygen-independent coproporphyrinogen-3 oxidase
VNYGLYLHFPFCRKKCDYCDFFSIPLEPESSTVDLTGAYLKRLVSEIHERLPGFSDGSIDTIYFGGGTPSIMEPEDASAVIEAIKSTIDIHPGSEITLEINPEDVRREKLEGFSDAGINRMVLGVQSINDRHHKTIGRASRVCSPQVLEEFFGYGDISRCIDVIIGIPGQDERELSDELEILTGFRPDHISAYMLTVEDGTPLSVRLDTAGLDSFQREAFKTAISLLKKQGYSHYEISNFCLDGKFSRHNMKYWKHRPYIGIGPSSHSFYGGRRYRNDMPLEFYINSDKTELEVDERTSGQEMAEYIMMSIRLVGGISLNEMEDCLGDVMPGQCFERFVAMKERGLVEIINKDGACRIRLTEEGLFLADTVIYDTVEPLL